MTFEIKMVARLLFLLLYLILISTTSPVNTSSATATLTSSITGTSPFNEPTLSSLIDAVYKSMKASNSVSFNFDSIVASDHVSSNDFILSDSIGNALASPILTENLPENKPFDSKTKVFAAPDTVQVTTLPPSNIPPQTIENSYCKDNPKTMLSELKLSKFADSLNKIAIPISVADCFATSSNTDPVITNPSSSQQLNDIQGNNLLSPILGLLAALSNGQITDSNLNGPCLSSESLALTSFDDFLIPCCPSIDTSYCVPDSIFSPNSGNANMNSLTSIFPFLTNSPILRTPEPYAVGSESIIDRASSVEIISPLELNSFLTNQNKVTSKFDPLPQDVFRNDQPNSVLNFSPSLYSAEVLSYHSPQSQLDLIDSTSTYSILPSYQPEIMLPDINYLPDIDLAASSLRQRQLDALFNQPILSANDNLINTFYPVPKPAREALNYVPLLNILSSPSFVLPTPLVQPDRYYIPHIPSVTQECASNKCVSSNNFPFYEPVNNLLESRPINNNFNILNFMSSTVPSNRPQSLNVLSKVDFVLPSPSLSAQSTKNFLRRTNIAVPKRYDYLPRTYPEYPTSIQTPRVPMNLTMFPVTTTSIVDPSSSKLELKFLPNMPKVKSFLSPLPYPYNNRDSSPFIIPLPSSHDPPRVPLLQNKINSSPNPINFTEPSSTTNKFYPDPLNSNLFVPNQFSSPIDIKPPELSSDPTPVQIYDVSRFLPKDNALPDSDIADTIYHKSKAFSSKFNNMKGNINKHKYALLQEEQNVSSPNNNNCYPLCDNSNSLANNNIQSSNLNNPQFTLKRSKFSILNNTSSFSSFKDYIANIKMSLSKSANELNLSSSFLQNSNTPAKNPTNLITRPYALLKSILSPSSILSLPPISNEIPNSNSQSESFLSNIIPGSDLLSSPVLPYISSVTVEVLPKNVTEMDSVTNPACKLPTVDCASNADITILDNLTDIDELLKLIFLAELIDDENVDTKIADEIFAKLYNSKIL